LYSIDLQYSTLYSFVVDDLREIESISASSSLFAPWPPPILNAAKAHQHLSTTSALFRSHSTFSRIECHSGLVTPLEGNQVPTFESVRNLKVAGIAKVPSKPLSFRLLKFSGKEVFRPAGPRTTMRYQPLQHIKVSSFDSLLPGCVVYRAATPKSQCSLSRQQQRTDLCCDD